MLLLIFIVSAVTLFLLFYYVLCHLFGTKMLISARLDRISKNNIKNQDNELNQPIFVRVIKPVLDDISKIIIKITPKEITGSLEKKIVMAGNPFNMTVKGWVNLQLLFLTLLPGLTLLIGYSRKLPSKNVILMCLAEIILGYLLPNTILKNKIKERQKKIMAVLPDVLDLLTVSVEAGLGFDGAISKVIERMPGPVSDEFGDVLNEIKVGKQKKDALKDMADRVGVQDLTTFVSSIIQADQFGVSIGNVLRLQSDQIRQKKKQRIQEKAMKAPVKMLIPMVLFIFPTIFMILLGPVVIRLIEAFNK
ncbi:MAG: type II secretion system F family protein [Bacillota bacterium]|nr:type II secretion system F family protein [Bacillota bacterium]